MIRRLWVVISLMVLPQATRAAKSGHAGSFFEWHRRARCFTNRSN